PVLVFDRRRHGQPVRYHRPDPWWVGAVAARPGVSIHDPGPVVVHGPMGHLPAAPMTFDSLLQHTVTIERTSYDNATLDEYRQPTPSTSTTDVAAMVQPRIRGAREVIDSRS